MAVFGEGSVLMSLFRCLGWGYGRIYVFFFFLISKSNIIKKRKAQSST
jgi:hypothetical protein